MVTDFIAMNLLSHFFPQWKWHIILLISVGLDF